MILTKILSTEDPQAISRAKTVIQKEGTIAFPTDTIYGVAADAFSTAGIQKIYEAKNRPQEKALPVLIGNLDQLALLVQFMSDEAERMMQAFWPGGLTLILPKGPKVPPALSSLPSIGIRMPKHPFTLKLLEETGPLATTSANLSGGSNPVTAQDVSDQLGGRIDLILDGGETPGPIPSTVVDLTGSSFAILREGIISSAEIHALF